MGYGKLARRIARAMFEKRILTREKLFTLPKPRAHLFCHLVDIVLPGSTERAHIDLRLVLRYIPSLIIPIWSNIPAKNIVIKQKKLPIIHPFLLALPTTSAPPFASTASVRPATDASSGSQRIADQETTSQLSLDPLFSKRSLQHHQR